MECLITKLKGSVASDMAKLGEIRLTIEKSVFASTGSTGKYITFIPTMDFSQFATTDDDCIVTVDNGAFFECGSVNLGNKIDLFKYTRSAYLLIVNPNNADITLTYSNKYYSPVIWGNIVDKYDNINSIKYCLSSTIRISKGLEGQTFKGLANGNYIQTLRINGCNIEEGVLNDYPKLTTVAGTISSGRTLPASLKVFSGIVEKWDLGDRESGNMLNMNDGVTFKDSDSLNNMLIDMSKCSPVDSLVMNAYCKKSYTPSEDALSAINVLKEHYTRLYIFNKDYVE